MCAFPVWFGDDPGDHYPATLEGGDVLVLAEDTVMVGLGERTAPAAVELLARRLFAAGPVRSGSSWCTCATTVR